MANRQLTGRVVDNTGKPQAGTEVWLWAAGVATVKGKAGDDGGFSLELGDEFVAGPYRVEALPTERALGGTCDVELPESGPPPPVQLTVDSRGAVSAVAGWAFLLLTIVAFLLLTGDYLRRHGFDLDQVERPDSSSVGRTRALSPDLSNILAIARQQAGEASTTLAEKGELTAEERATASAEALASSMAVDSLDAAEAIFSDLKKRRLGTLDASKATAVESLFEQAKKAAEGHDVAGLESAIANLERTVVEEQEPFFWSGRPEVLLEALYWALAATLIRLIFNTGLYLYKRRFLATAIPHHIAIAISVPMLAVLISFVLSLVKVALSLSDAELVLDMNNVYIVILVAAMIGFAPWKAWNFLQEMSDLLFEKLGGLFKSGPPESSPPESSPPES